MNISIIWSFSLLLVIVFITLVQITQNNMTQTNENWSQFECGFNLINPSHIPFSFQFFIISLLFLIFDVEIALILSYPLEPISTNNLTVIFTFLAVLTIGLLYEWQNSNINWSE